MVTTKVKFGEPPPRRAQSYDWSAIAKQLKDNPNEWGRVFTNDRYSLVAAVSTEKIAVFQTTGEGHFETRTENNHNVEEGGVTRRHCDLWMRFVPVKSVKKKVK